MDEDRQSDVDSVADAGADTDTDTDAPLSEDEKIERFYALIRNYKEIRDRQRIERERTEEQKPDRDRDGDHEKRRQSVKRMKLAGDQEQPSWIPAFQWEDFDVRRTPPAANLNDSPPEIDGPAGVDLKLRL